MASPSRDMRERLMAKVIVLESGCWQWTGGTNEKGYGRLWTSRKKDKEYAHRLSYEIHVGPIPVGMEIDHLCRNRSCVNPAHLEAVTRRVNQIRGESVSGKNHRKTHCAKGHEFTPSNTYRPSTGGRQCVTCRRDYRAAHVEEAREYRRRYLAKQ